MLIACQLGFGLVIDSPPVSLFPNKHLDQGEAPETERGRTSMYARGPFTLAVK